MGKSKWSITPEQREALLALRRRMWEKGLKVCAVAKQFRQRRDDFAVLADDVTRHVLVVRPTAKGTISVQPTESPEIYTKERKIINSIQKLCPIEWIDQPDPTGPKCIHYISITDRKRLGLDRT